MLSSQKNINSYLQKRKENFKPVSTIIESETHIKSANGSDLSRDFKEKAKDVVQPAITEN
jgi:hypothetical protein